MNDYIKIINLEYDSEALVEEHKRVSFKPFSTEKKHGGWFDYAPTWLQGRVYDEELSNYSEITRLTNYLKHTLVTQNIRPRFYKQEANTSVPMHSDIGTQCCVNIILSETSAPIIFENIGPISYSCALLNITKRHEVPAFNRERLLLKFSIFDISYEEAYEVL